MWKLSVKKINGIGYTGAAIYKLHFDNGERFYIGSTTCVGEKTDRIRERFRTGKISKKMKHFIKDKTKCQFEVLEKVNDLSKLLEIEGEYIRKNASHTGMLNRIKVGANGWYRRTKTERESVGKWSIGRVVSEEERKHALDVHVKLKRTTSVIKYNLKGRKIKTYKSMGEAARAMNVNHATIHKNCHGLIKTVHGFVFKIKDQALLTYKTHSLQRKKIFVVDESGNENQKFDCIRDAATHFGISEKGISSVLNGRRTTHKGFRFKFA